jgi:hypothetical protein
VQLLLILPLAPLVVMACGYGVDARTSAAILLLGVAAYTFAWYVTQADKRQRGRQNIHIDEGKGENVYT